MNTCLTIWTLYVLVGSFLFFCFSLDLDMDGEMYSMFTGGEGFFQANSGGCLFNGMSTLRAPHLPEYSSSAGFPLIPTTDLETYSFFSEEYPALSQKQITESSTNDDGQNQSSEKLKMPKDEPVEITDESTDPFKFEFTGLDQIPHLYHDSTFHQLPNLSSLERVPANELSIAESSQKRLNYEEPPLDYTLDAIVRSFKLSDSSFLQAYEPPPPPAPAAISRRVSVTKQRRERISEKTQCLQKLMPWDKKMNIATTLEETYKYVKFLRAQIKVLRSMPCLSHFSFQNSSEVDVDGGEFDGLKKLTRQQLLQILVNSPVAQTKLYSQGCCVFSAEQLVLLQNNPMEETRSSTASKHS